MPGAWTASGALVDEAKNSRSFESESLKAQGFPGTVQVNDSTADTEAPVFQSLSFSPATVDTSSSSQTVTVTAHITDNQSGVGSESFIWFRSPDRSITLSGARFFLVSGTSTDGTYQATETFPKSSMPGAWTASGALVDEAKNSRSFESESLKAQGFPGTVEVGPEPTVSRVAPGSGPANGGTSVAITGTSFIGAIEVKFGSTKASSFNVNSPSTITAVSPSGSGAVDVTVTTSAGTSSTSSADQFSYLPVIELTQQGPKLAATSETGTGKLGRSTAISATGDTALVGAPGDNGSVGAAFVYTRSGSTWTQQAELTATGETGAGLLGESVALSADGNTAVVGAPADSTKAGAAWVFTRSGSTWTQGPKLTGSGESGKGQFGSSVSLSSDASTALIGGEGDNSSNGAAWAFGHSGSTWTQQGSKISPSDEIGKGKFGAGVALSSTGTTGLIGSSADNINAGAAWPFTRSGSTWTQQAKLTGSGESGEGHLGVSVALSSDGNTALVGAQGDNGTIGAAFAYERSGTSWSQQGSKLTGGGESGTGHFGQSVTLSSDGNTAVIGAYGDEGAAGAAFQFTRSGAAWSQLAKLTGTGGTASAQFGESVALSGDAKTAVIGGPGDMGGVGAAWIFAVPTATPTVTGVSPNEGPETGGTSVTITGTNLSAVNSVKFGSTNAASFTVNSSTSITATAPAGSGTVDVTVSTSSNGSAVVPQDQFSYIAAPTVTALSPTSGSPGGGTSVTITGTNLSGATSVKFGSTNAQSFTVNASNSITAVSPSGTGTVDVTVTTVGGTSATSTADRFNYAPAVTGVSPSTGPAGGGTSVTITGTNFSGVSAVKFGSTTATGFTVNSPTSITATSPAGTGTVDITVTTGGGSSPTVVADQFSYIAEPPPTVSKIKPASGRGSGGTTVSITGSRFTGATAVKFGSTPATSYVVSSDSLIKAVAPAGSGTVDIRVMTAQGTSAISAADQFSYKAETPTVTGVSPNHGSTAGGNTVTVTGTNFALGSATTFKFGTIAGVSASCTSTTSCTVTAPAAKKGKAATIDVVAAVGKAKSKKTAADKYAYS